MAGHIWFDRRINFGSHAVNNSRHARPCAGPPRLYNQRKTGLSGTSPATTRDPRSLPNAMTPRTATLIGLTAILMWSLLAVMTVATGTIPAFQLAAMTFAIGALVGALAWIGRPDAVKAL